MGVEVWVGGGRCSMSCEVRLEGGVWGEKRRGFPMLRRRGCRVLLYFQGSHSTGLLSYI